MNKNNKSEFDQYKSTYSDDINEAVSFAGKDQSFFTQRKADYLVKILNSNNYNKAKVLDVGCGHGLIHPYLSSSTDINIDLHAVDMAGDVIDIARETNSNVEYAVHDGTTLPYENNSFDAAYAICVMHHVPPNQWGSFLLELKRVVKPNGKVIIFEHNPHNPITMRVVNNCPMDSEAVLLKHTLLKNIFKECGLNNLQCKSILFTPFTGIIFKKLDNLLGWIPLGAQYYIVGTK